MPRPMPRPLHAALAALALACLVLAPGPARAWTLTILHTNDVHSRLIEFDGSGRLCLEPGADCAGGAARLLAAVRGVRAEGGAVVLLDAGDQFTGTPLFSRRRGAAAARLMRLAGYDAMALGNHEFDLGPQALESFAGELGFPLLAANVEAPDRPGLGRLLEPYAIVRRQGRTIGIIGALTPETATLAKDAAWAVFRPLAPAVTMAAHELRASGAEVVICLTHQGYVRDLELAASVPGLDVIVGGHSHTELGAGPDAAGPYPTVVASPRGEPVLVVTDGKWGRRLGRLDVEFDEAGTAVAWSGAPLDLGPQAPRDPEGQELERAWTAELGDYLKQPAGTLRAALDGAKGTCRSGECALGDAVAEAALEALRGAGARLALINAGSIRAGLPAGPVTKGDLATVLPFGNRLILARLTGAEILAALEHGVSRAAPGEAGQGGTGRFLQVAGLRYAWTPLAPPGGRLVSAQVRLPGGGFEPVDPGRVYTVVLSDYRAAGGDGYAMLAGPGGQGYDTSIPLVQALGDWIMARSPLAVATDGRIHAAGP